MLNSFVKGIEKEILCYEMFPSSLCFHSQSYDFVCGFW